MGQTQYDLASGLEIPGIEAIMELGQVNDLSSGATDTNLRASRIPGAYSINDQSRLERPRLQQVDGLYDDPEIQDLRTKLPDHHGERAGLMSYAGRTLGLTGVIEGGSVGAVRDVNRRLRSSFVEAEQSLLLHPVGEAVQYVNRAPDPLSAAAGPATYVSTATSTGGGTWAVTSATDVFTTTQVASTVNPTTAPGTVFPFPTPPWWMGWQGEDMWINTRVKLVSAGAAGSSFSLLLVPADASGARITTITAATQLAPVAGTWYQISGLVPASSIPSRTAGFYVTVQLNFASVAAYSYRLTRVAMIPIPPGAIAPTGYFDGTFPGYEWDGSAPATSRGPGYVVNQVRDPFGAAATTWWAASNTSGATTNVAPTTTVPGKSGLVSPSGQSVGAVYYMATNPDTTSRSLGLAVASPNRFVVAGGRVYKAGATLNVLQKPIVALNVQVVWLDQAGASLGTTTIASASVGTGAYYGVVVALSGSVTAYLQIVTSSTTVSGAVLELYASRAMFCDVDNHGFSVVGDEDYAVFDGSNAYHGYRAPLTRPWLVKEVRKASYACPEHQSGAKPSRPFTASLRASDPRIYMLDERNVQLTMSGTLNYSGLITASSVMPVGTAWTTVPTGFTFDTTPTYTTPVYTVVPGTTADIYVAGGTGAIANATAGTSRFYNSARTYTQPRVEMICDPAPYTPAGLPVYFYGQWERSVGIILKRTSATNYIEIRWNASYNGQVNPVGGGTNAGHELEILVNSGSGAAVRAGFDSQHTLDGAPYILVAYLTSTNDVYAELVPVGTLMSGVSYTPYVQIKYSLLSGEITALGTGVSGSAGIVLVDGPSPDAGVHANSGTGSVRSFVSRNNDFVYPTTTIPVMGDIDTPPVVVLQGGIANPALSFQGEDGGSSLMAFNDTFTTPTRVNYKDGTIMDAAGVNKFPSLLAGSSIRPLSPGANKLTVSASSWLTGPHVVTWWRDARK